MNDTRRARQFISWAIATIVLLYLVILAGSVVRASGSGMGCPDWPKCFGYYIPPTDPSQVEFHANQAYKKNMMIIVSDTLWRAKADFTSAGSFDKVNWEKYPVHNYAKFYVYQTWTEYINRLVGALSGLSMFIMGIFSLFTWKKDRRIVMLMLLAAFLLGFVAWMGKVVVDQNLKPLTITVHMGSAFALVAISIYTLFRVRNLYSFGKQQEVPGGVYWLLAGVFLLTLIQVFVGTQVRQDVDAVNKVMDNLHRETWIRQLSGIFSLHWLLSLPVIILNGFLFVRLRRLPLDALSKKIAWWMIVLLVSEYAVGLILSQFGIPAFAQPVHLLFAAIVFGLQFSLVTNLYAGKKTV
ncbi:MAG: cytochrome oxidase assembly protein [Bacteroidetes bacterium]|nr:MAG: cytochrome oxidase assembly protein [Bacteroidota bacterium]